MTNLQTTISNMENTMYLNHEELFHTFNNILVDDIVDCSDLEELQEWCTNGCLNARIGSVTALTLNQTERIFKLHSLEILEIAENYREEGIQLELTPNSLVWTAWEWFIICLNEEIEGMIEDLKQGN